MRINAGRGEVRLASDSSEYNDAAFHSILVTKQGRRLELRVDDVSTYFNTKVDVYHRDAGFIRIEFNARLTRI